MKQYMSKMMRKFERDERGSFSLFAATMASTMILIGGSAIDIVRHEAVRSSIQYNLDRAVLAAASLRQTGDAEEAGDIVREYMSKVSSLASFQADIDPEKTEVSLTGRTVSAYATAELDTYFLGLMGLDTLDVRVESTASERIPNLEISMVLDVSGSMQGSKISNLKVAANKFIDTVIKEPSVVAAENTVTAVSIVPYATNVSLPESMFDLYTTEDHHDDHHCIIFDHDEYAATELPTSVELKQLSSYAFNRYYGGSLNKVRDCRTSAYSEILPFSTSKDDLKAKINSLQATGSTATHIGTRWGAALLDRGAVPIANALGSPEAADHPKSFTEAGVLKALIVMSDGNNTSHRRLKDDYRSGPSNVYKVNGSQYAGHYMQRSDGKYYKIGYDSSYNDYWFIYDYNWNKIKYDSLPEGITEQLDWADTWDLLTLYDYVQISDQVSSVNTLYGNETSAQEADTAMRATCEAAKQHDNLVVYTIYFGDANTTSNGSSNAETLLSDCASGPGQFYNVTALDIEAAFASIAISVQKLKLTQ
ncbi:VWA domain-containing protein [Amylibacter sp. SFDW26]|uniref:VWA domain-containing protein n=1 Tax=Amylibacter sp. SFDW26 TaxID=2652722 RepID=UPI0012615A72|nr:VWA domain-containing protein [Amylibacter sp. SFDW26]KAB7616229.1 VWA domain-containing protein [Amylibacter sp. SFDW26]